MNDYLVTYAQNREDIILSGFFNKDEKGFYVDVGAYHPENDSVTKIFYDRGWRGINIEPNPNLYEVFTRTRPRDINLNLGVSDKAGKLRLREYLDAEGYSTFSPLMQQEYTRDSSTLTKRYVDHDITVLPLQDIFKQYQVGQIDFMKIDVEGFEYEVIVGNDWNKYRPKVLCIEANHIYKDKNWQQIIRKHNYSLVFFDGLNEYYVAKEQADIAEHFSYVQTMLPKVPVPVGIHNNIEELKKHQTDQEQMILMLQKQQRDVRFLAKRLHHEIQSRLNKRASGNRGKTTNSLIYAQNKSIQEKVQHPPDDKDELLSFIHDQDRHNIRRQRQSGLNKTAKSITWKATAKAFNMGTAVSKKIARRVR